MDWRETSWLKHALNGLARFLQFAVVLVTGYISCSNNTLIIVIMIGVIIIVTVVGVDTVIAHLVLCICVEAGRLSAAATVTLAAVSSSVHILGVGMWLRVAAVSIIVVMGVVIVLRALVRARECRHGVCHGPSCSVLCKARATETEAIRAAAIKLVVELKGTWTGR